MTNHKTYFYNDLISNIDQYFTVIGIILFIFLIILGITAIFVPKISDSVGTKKDYISNILSKLGASTSFEDNFISVLNIIIEDLSKVLDYKSDKQNNIFLTMFSYIKKPIISTITSIILYFSIVPYKLNNFPTILDKSIIVALRLSAIILWLLIFFTVIYIIIYLCSILFIGYFYDTTIASYGMNLILPFIFVIIIIILRKYKLFQDITMSEPVELNEFSNRIGGGRAGRKIKKKNKY